MKVHIFKNEKDQERHEKQADVALNKWLQKYSIGGLSVGKDKDGNVVRIQFNSRTNYQVPMPDETKTINTPEAIKEDVFIDEFGRRTNSPPKGKDTKKKSGGCSGCGKKETGAGRLKRLVTGGAKLLKAELGIDAADEATIIERKEICLSCEIYEFGVCEESRGGCGCFLAAKVKLKSEQCPIDKWLAVEVMINGN